MTLQFLDYVLPDPPLYPDWVTAFTSPFCDLAFLTRFNAQIYLLQGKYGDLLVWTLREYFPEPLHPSGHFTDNYQHWRDLHHERHVLTTMMRVPTHADVDAMLADAKATLPEFLMSLAL